MNRELNPQWQRGGMLVAFLNKERKPKQKSSERYQWAPTLDTVAELIEALKKLDSLLQEKPLEYERELERERLEISVNRMIERRHFRPVLRAHSRLEVDWLIANKPKINRAQMKAWHEAGGVMSNIPIGRDAAIQIVLEMAPAGSLERVRRCRCGLWFLAVPSLKKTFCGDACRFEKYQSTQEYKKERREYMRRYMRNARVKTRRKLLASTRPQKTR